MSSSAPDSDPATFPLSTPLRPRVVLKARRARPFFARHPWVLVNSIERIEWSDSVDKIMPGAEVDLVSFEGKWIARGLYNPSSSIRVRLYRWEDGSLDSPFWNQRLEEAVRFRQITLAVPLALEDPASACRLVYSEADGLSGLIVDRYADWLAIQFNGLGMYRRKDHLIPKLLELTGAVGAVARFDKVIADQEGLAESDKVMVGEPPSAPLEIRQDGLTYLADVLYGQKTGLYLDQRLNRLAAARYARGRCVLDLYCHVGGFSLVALKHGGAVSSLGFDSSSVAVEFARRHAVINHLPTARFEVAHVPDALKMLKATGRTFGMVVVDPPKFARSTKGVEEAVKAYVRLNCDAVSLLEPDGILVTCSCSGLIERELFLQLLGHVAEQTGRTIQILESRGQAPDHPVAANCLETDYLKCVIARIL